MNLTLYSKGVNTSLSISDWLCYDSGEDQRTLPWPMWARPPPPPCTGRSERRPRSTTAHPTSDMSPGYRRTEEGRRRVRRAINMGGAGASQGQGQVRGGGGKSGAGASQGRFKS